jgi:Uncharacterized conserved protein
MLLRERDTAKGVLVSVCDEDCLGETYEDGDVSLEVTEEFYAGETATDADAETVIDALRGRPSGTSSARIPSASPLMPDWSTRIVCWISTGYSTPNSCGYRIGSDRSLSAVGSIDFLCRATFCIDALHELSEPIEPVIS